MRIVRETKVKSGKDLYTEKYEFRYCTGSIEPDEGGGEQTPVNRAEQRDSDQR